MIAVRLKNIMENDGNYRWSYYNNKIICRNHYSKLVTNKRQTPEYKKKYNSKRPKGFGKKYNDRRILFLGKIITLSWKIRTGYCSLCPNNIFDKSCNQTQTHHWFYVPIMVWACTVELCGACHMYTKFQLQELKSIPLDRKCSRCGKTEAQKHTTWMNKNNKWYCKICDQYYNRELLRTLTDIIARDFLYIG